MAKQPIGEFLCTLRKAHGYTQQEVADKLGVSNRTISAWEQGRAYPDLLTLPAIAEIYGVTADEILNGERKPATGLTGEVSEKNLVKLYKSKLSAFSSKMTALAGTGAGGAALFLLMSAIGGFAPGWLLVIFCVLAVADAITVLTLLISFDGTARIAVGIYRGDEPDDSQSKFVFDMRMCEVRFLLITGGVWSLCGIAAFWLLSFIYNIEFLTTLGYALFVITLVFGAGMLISAIVLYHKEISLRGSERDKRIRGKRFKLAGKCAAYLGIPLGICLIFCVTFSFVFIPTTTKASYFPASREEFIKASHSFSVGMNFLDEGQYFLDVDDVLKTQPNEDGSYALNERGTLRVRFDDEANVCIIEGLGTNGKYSTVITAERMFVEDSDERIYDFRNLNNPESRGKHFLWLEVLTYQRGKTVVVADDVYSVKFDYSLNYASVIVSLSWLIMLIAFITDFAVYLVLAVKIK